MATQLERILVTTGALLVAGILATAIWASRQTVPAWQPAAPWISVPPESEFDAGANARITLLRTGPLLGDLPDACGRSDQPRIEQRYVAIFDNGAFDTFYRADFDIRDAKASVEVDLASRASGEGAYPRLHTRRVFHADTKELLAIQRAWSEPTLWQAPPEPLFLCVSSGGTILQSCVQGRYTLSVQHCSGTPATEALKAAIQSKFPLPLPDR
ncbi:hypothetical protein LVB77_18705 [Lysobacter sp. 5GHs7-4]|uniref:hypothetical protein n=1 Tax=Lysobacter sp. 5GHs7-4 TaxID=2904253 RepID=UPI001E4B0840|nr:hypothetical protein [Lysobacter sp. 5GHs7-4]UHQ22654.1 hypothetical protein LVB77_18705 [Lysobacter sp. 5GHs7-4]